MIDDAGTINMVTQVLELLRRLKNSSKIVEVYQGVSAEEFPSMCKIWETFSSLSLEEEEAVVWEVVAELVNRRQAQSKGNGIKPGAKVKTCSSCKGQGMVNNMQRTPFGVFQNVQTCPNCRGSGEEVEEYCPTCRGRGATSNVENVNVKIPAGVETGTALRIREAGNAGLRGGPRGDLYVTLNVRRDPKFRREAADIYTEEDISYVDAILGCTVKADTVDGKMDLKVPAGTQPDQKLRIKGKGAPRLGTDVRGDQIVTVKVKIPVNVSGKEKELVEQISELSKKKGGFFNFGGSDK
eukprot:gene203-205_t